jgi:hypothetical protein
MRAGARKPGLPHIPFVRSSLLDCGVGPYSSPWHHLERWARTRRRSARLACATEASGGHRRSLCRLTSGGLDRAARSLGRRCHRAGSRDDGVAGIGAVACDLAARPSRKARAEGTLRPAACPGCAAGVAPRAAPPDVPRSVVLHSAGGTRSRSGAVGHSRLGQRHDERAPPRREHGLLCSCALRRACRAPSCRSWRRSAAPVVSSKQGRPRSSGRRSRTRRIAHRSKRWRAGTPFA